jgi:hypothetical protein
MSLDADHSVPAGPSCSRSSLSPLTRLLVAFAVLLALKWALPLTPVAPTAQVLMLLVVASLFIWRFWWHCSPNRRGALAMGVLLWVAGVLKVVVSA